MLETAHDRLPGLRPQPAGEPIDVVVRTTCEGSRRKSLQRAIASVVAQRGVAARPVVVIAGPRPEPLPKLASRNGIRVHRIGTEASPGRALTIARGLVDAPFFAFLDDDDELLPDALSKRVAILRADPRVQVVVTTGYVERGKARHVQINDIARHQDDPLRGIVERCWLASCGGLFRTDAVPPAMFDALPDLCEWTCVAFRLAVAGCSIRFVDRPTYVVHDSACSLSKSDAFVEASLHVLDSMRSAPLSAADRRRLAHKYRATLHDAAERCRRAGNVGQAWRYHLRSMQPPGTLRYAAYTRKLMWNGNGDAA
ncbi:MAG TPA: glycosyltransferase [Casimicrobiaceae bacterium]|nr:glycosyltransferase [Casimicrobiaceae bacterium]